MIWTQILFVILLANQLQSIEYKQTICETENRYLDSVVEFSDRRIFTIEDQFYEYDLHYNYQRRGFEYFEIRNLLTIPFGRYISGFHIHYFGQCDLHFPPDSSDKMHSNCNHLNSTLSDVMITVIEGRFTGKNYAISQKFAPKEFTELVPVNGNDECKDKQMCGPYNTKYQTYANEWLLKYVSGSTQFRFLPTLFVSKNMTLLVVLNKETEFVGGVLREFRDKTQFLGKSLANHLNDTHPWTRFNIDNDYIYTAFVRHNQHIYLIGEPYRPANDPKRGPQYLFEVNVENLKSITITKTDMNPFEELFGCVFNDTDWLAIVVIITLFVIVISLIVSWIFVCFYFYSTTWSTSKSVQRSNSRSKTTVDTISQK